MKVHGRFKMLRIAETSGKFLYRCNLGIHPHGLHIGNAMRKVGHHIRQMPIDQLGRDDNGLEAAVDSSEIPTLPERLSPSEKLSSIVGSTA